jgi:hypothetical protein
MVELDATAKASLRFYGILKSTTQIATYVGVVATASLSVFDLFYKQKADPPAGSDRYVLNKSGRNRLIAFIVISAFTLCSTITKDYADHKLDGMAKEEAQAKLEETLGGSFEQFTKKTLGPSLDGIRADIDSERDNLDSNIDTAVSTLNQALDTSKSEIQRANREEAAEAEAASAQLSSFVVRLEYASAPSGSIVLNETKREKDWKNSYLQKCSDPNFRSDDKLLRSCTTFGRELGDLHNLAPFLTLLDPSTKGTLDVTIVLRSFFISVSIPAKCEVGAEACVIAADMDDLSHQHTQVEVWEAEKHSPVIGTFRESRHVQRFFEPTGHKAVDPLTDKYGRDADLIDVGFVAIGNKQLLSRLPKQLILKQYLNITGGSLLKRQYRLRLTEVHDNGSVGPDHKYAIQYARY